MAWDWRFVCGVVEVYRSYPLTGAWGSGGGCSSHPLAFAVAALHPEAIAGAVPIGGMLSPELIRSACGVPVRALHGGADSVVPAAEARRTVAELKAAGCDVSLRESAGVDHEIPPEMREVLMGGGGAGGRVNAPAARTCRQFVTGSSIFRWRQPLPC